MDKEQTERFLSRISIGRDEDCWEWQRGLNSGYGWFHITPGVGRMAHRLSWEMEHGPIPAGLIILHHCDNPKCCNPAHMSVGTHGENAADRDAKGRLPCGEQRAQTLLSDERVGDMALLRGIGMTYAELGRLFGISSETAWRNLNGMRAKHLKDKGLL
jgi:HNH endonuclease